jgi:ring-1,2-phenylacetyl-CoA epoxidase subunit PaaE
MLQLKVEAIKWETADTATFYFSEGNANKIIYKPGQFISIVFKHHDEEIRRAFSISSAPYEQLLSITVKRIQNGEISRFLLSKVKVGDIFNAVEPAGRFVPNNYQEAKDLFYFAAGSGMVPIFSHLKHILSRDGESKIKLIYSSMNEDAIIFKKELDALANENQERLRIIYLLSSNGNRLNNIMVEKLVNQNRAFPKDQAEFYLCGPFSYMRMVSLTLQYMGIDAEQIRKENFVVETIDVTGSFKSFPPKNIKIFFGGESHDLPVGENQSILQAALQNNIPLPYSCKGGVCSTCIAVCKTGTIEMVKNEVLTERDLAEGLILTCTGHPMTDDVMIAFE